MSREKLVKKLAIAQKQIQLKLDEIRETHQHKGSKGSNVEQIIRDFLTVYFPSDNRIGQGEVIDCVFRSIPATYSGTNRPPIPLDSGHLFRSIPATLKSYNL